MKKYYKGLLLFGLLFIVSFSTVAFGEDNKNTIAEGVFIGHIDVSGLSYDVAKGAIDEYIDNLQSSVITLKVGNNSVIATAGNFGLKWSNSKVLKEAVGLCKEGNIIKRYKDKVDIEDSKKIYSIKTGINTKNVKEKLIEMCSQYEVPAKNATIKMVDGVFKITDETDGITIDYDNTAKELIDKTSSDWDGKNLTMDAKTTIKKANITREDCEKVSYTPLASYSTEFSLYNSDENRNRNGNIQNGAKILNDIVLYPGEVYGCGSHLAPWTTEHGWLEGGTYENGKESTGMGGGICQVSTTLYNALIRAEIEIVNRFNHSMTVDYVPLSADAAIAEGSKDLVFKNNTDAPIYIKSSFNASGVITYSVYGHDTRKVGRSVEFVSETNSTTPSGETIVNDPTKPVGYREVAEEGYTGYTATLWKVVKQDGVEVSKTVFNTSSYRATNTEVVVGTKQPETTPPKETTPSKETTTPKETTPKAETTTPKAEK